MVIDTGQIKAEVRGEEKRKEKKKIHESIRITIQMLKLYFLTFKPGN